MLFHNVIGTDVSIREREMSDDKQQQLQHKNFRTIALWDNHITTIFLMIPRCCFFWQRLTAQIKSIFEVTLA